MNNLTSKIESNLILDPNIFDIISRCKSGDRISQEKLYRLFSDKLFGICLRYTKNSDEAQDILHEGFIKVFENIKQLKEPNALFGWMKKIMINKAFEHFRNAKPTESIHEIRIIKDETHISADDAIREKELLKLVQNLSPQYRLVFNLYAIEGYSHKEISKMLKISEGTSKSNLSRAREILQNKIKKVYNINELQYKSDGE